MSDALIIRLGSDDAAVQYLLVDASGGRLGSVLTGPIAQAAPLAANRRVIVLIPATEVTSAEPELPAKNATKLAQLAPYALEEQLATDIDSMHFAVGKRGINGKTPVAAVHRERFESWLTALRAGGIEPDAMYSEAAVVPSPGESTGATIIVDNNLVYARHSQSPAFVIDAEPLEESLHLALGQTLDGDNPILRDLQVFVAQEDYDRSPSAFEAIAQRIQGLQIKLLPEGALPLFALEAAKNSAVDFLCGAYERKSSFSASFEPWRYAAVLVGVAAVLHFSYSGIRLWQASGVEKNLDRQIRELVVQTLPGTTLDDPRNGRKQFESRLSAARQGGGNGDLLMSLATLGQALAQAPDTRIEALSYRTQTIDLRVTAPNVDALDKIQQSTTAAGLVTQIQSATPRDSKVEGRLQLKSGA